MKFLVPNYSCLQNPWLGGYRPQIPVLSVLCPQLNLLTPTPPPEQNSRVRHWWHVMPFNFVILRQLSGILPAHFGSHYTLFTFPVMNTTAHKKGAKTARFYYPNNPKSDNVHTTLHPSAYLAKMWDESSDGPSALCYGTSISVIKVSQTQLDYELFYSTRCFGLSWLGHHQVVDILLRKL